MLKYITSIKTTQLRLEPNLDQRTKQIVMVSAALFILFIKL